MAPRIVFHIGLTKTGTTSFQRFCKDERRWLQANGVLYPRSQLGLSRNHSPLVASYIPHRPEGPTVALRWAPRERAVAALKAEIDASPCRVVLISSEHFSAHFAKAEARQLAADFGAYDPLVVVTLRDTHARFFSSYNTHVTAGGRLAIEPYARSVLIPGTRYMSARETVLIWRAAFGAGRLRMIDYDAETDVTAAILRHCGIEAKLPATSAYRDRKSLGPDAVEALRRANEAISERQTVPAKQSIAAWLQLTLFSFLCRRRLETYAPPAASTGWIISSQTLAALDTIAATDQAWFADTCGLTLRGSQARRRIVATDSGRPPATEAEMEQSRAMLSRVAGPWWAISQLFVMLWDQTINAVVQLKRVAHRLHRPH